MTLATWRELRAQAASVTARIEKPGDSGGDVTNITDPGLFPQGTNAIFQITAPGQGVVNRSPSAPTLPASPTPAGRVGFSGQGATRLAYITVPVQDQLGETRLLTVAVPWAPFANSVDALRTVLEVVGGVAIVVGAAGGVAISHSALRPVEDITRAVRRIGPDDLGVRLPVNGPADELYRLRTTFNDLLARIDEANRRQVAFIADASHELRSPVAVIEGYAGLLLRWGKDEPKVLLESLEAIARESHWLARLVGDLITVTRLDAHPEHPSEAVDLIGVVEETVNDARAVAPTLKIDYESAGTPIVSGDRGRLRQLLFILLDNAIRYTPEGGCVTVKVYTEANTSCVSVQDTGVGIAPKDLPHVFDRFYRADKARERSGGVGLGLAIARGIVRSYGGMVDMESTLGVGTSVQVRLPLLRN